MTSAPPGGEGPWSPHPPEVLEQVVAALSPLVTPERLARMDDVLSRRTRDVVVVLEDIANEHNAAAVLRSAEAFGFFELHIVELSARFHASQHVASGAEKWMHLRRHASTTAAYEELRGRGYQIWASVLAHQPLPVHQVPIEAKVALVFGNEHRGLSDLAISEADARFMVPMLGFVESFNISVAVATACYDLLSRRRIAGRPVGLDAHDQLCTRAAWLVASVRSSREVLARLELPVPELRQAFVPPMVDTEKTP